MLYFFYELYFEFQFERDKDGYPITDHADLMYLSTKVKMEKSLRPTKQFGIGYFSTKAKAEKQIQHHKNLSGFRDYPVDCFKIKKYGVKFDKKIEDKSLIDLYVLSHEYYDGEYDHALILPPFSTKKEAMAQRRILEKIKPYCDYPDEFIIENYSVDRYIEWTEGFCTLGLENLEG